MCYIGTRRVPEGSQTNWDQKVKRPGRPGKEHMDMIAVFWKCIWYYIMFLAYGNCICELKNIMDQCVCYWYTDFIWHAYMMHGWNCELYQFYDFMFYEYVEIYEFMKWVMKLIWKQITLLWLWARKGRCIISRG